VLIRVLAEQMIRLAGKQPGTDIAIVYTGLRPGEKLHERLFYTDEDSRPTSHPKVLEAGVREFSAERVLGSIARLREAVASYDVDAMQAILVATIPEYSPLQEALEPQAGTNIVPFPSKEIGRN